MGLAVEQPHVVGVAGCEGDCVGGTDLAARGASREVMLEQLAELADSAKNLTPFQRSQLMATLDNQFGLTEAGAAQQSVADLYMPNEETDRLRRITDSAESLTEEQRAQGRAARLMEMKREAEEDIRNRQGVTAEDKSSNRQSKDGTGRTQLSGLLGVVGNEQAASRLNEANRLLLKLAAENTGIDLGYDPEQIREEAAADPVARLTRQGPERRGGQIDMQARREQLRKEQVARAAEVQQREDAAIEALRRKREIEAREREQTAQKERDDRLAQQAADLAEQKKREELRKEELSEVDRLRRRFGR